MGNQGNSDVAESLLNLLIGTKDNKEFDGKINKFFETNCLLQQEFVKNGDFKVEAYLASKGVKLTNFVRFEKGEGLQKKEENFADEVMKQIK